MEASSNPAQALQTSLDRIVQACDAVSQKAEEVRAALPEGLPAPFQQKLRELFALIEQHLA